MHKNRLGRILFAALLCGAVVIATPRAADAGWTDIAHGNAHNGAGNAVSVSLTGISSGDVVIAFVATSSTSATISITNGGDTFTARTSAQQLNGSILVQFFDCLSATVTGSVTYTVTTTPDSFRKLEVWVFRASGGTPSFDAGTGQGDVTSSHSSGNVTTTGTVELSIAGASDDNVGAVSNMQINGVAATGSDVDSNNWPVFYALESSTYTGAATWTEASGTSAATVVVTYKISGGGGGGGAKSLLLLGVGLPDAA